MGKINGFILEGPELDVPIPEMSVGQKIYDCLRNLPADSVMLTEAETEKEITASQLLQESVDVASGLKELGVTKDDRVAIIGENTIEICIAGFATMYLGAPMCPIDPTLKSLEFQHILNIMQPKVVFCDYDILPEVQDALSKLESEAKVIVLQADGQTLEDESLLTMEDVKKEWDTTEFIPEPINDVATDLAVIVCSSGTTGMPKGVGLSHKALFFQVGLSGSVWPKGTFIHTSYFYWVSGVLIMMGTTVNGVHRLLVKTTDPLEIMKAIDKYKPLMGLMTPSLLSSILHHQKFSEFDFTNFKGVTVGGAPITNALVDIFKELMPHCFMKGGYGCSELAGLISQAAPPTDILSLGTIVPNTQVKVIDPNTGETLGPEKEGEIVCRSPSMMNGYVANEKATKEAIDEDGWYHTGDIGKYNNEGVLYLTGRAKELMKVDGHQISPEEIECVIAGIDGVIDVVVTGIQVEENNLPMALVVKKFTSELTEDDIINVVNNYLSEFKQLRAGVCFVKNIPKTSTGKIKRRAVQPIAEALYRNSSRSGPFNQLFKNLLQNTISQAQYLTLGTE